MRGSGAGKLRILGRAGTVLGVRLLRFFPVLLAVACAGASSQAPPRIAAASLPSAAPTVPVPAPPLASSSPPAAPPPPVFPHDAAARARLTAAVGALLDGEQGRGLTHGVVLLDAETGEQLVARGEEVPLTPASNTKLFTTLGALDLLGAEHRPQIRFELVEVKGARAAALVVDGGLCPLGAPFVAMEQAAASLLKTLAERKISRIDRLVVRTPALVAPDRFQELDLAQHRDRTASRLRKALNKAKVGLGKLAKETSVEGEAAASHQGPTLAEWITPINQLSHNGFADGLSQYLGMSKGKGVGYPEGTRLALEAMRARKIEGIALADGSGLSRQNKVTAGHVAALLRGARDVAPFVASLAVAGEVGTLAGRLKETPLQGRVRGKTGTLKEVVATSGYLDHPVDGRRYVFALITNGVQEGKGAEVRQLHDALLLALGDAWMR